MAQTLPPSSNRSHTFHSFVTPEVTPEGSPVSQRISDSRTPFHPTPNENSRRRLLNDFFKILASWVRLVWLDFLVLLFILFLAWLFDSRIRVFRQHNRTFPMWLEPPDRWYGPPSISQPRQQLIVSNLVAAMVVTAVPVVVFLMTQIIIRDFWDANAAIFGLLKGLALMTFIQTALKLLFGAFRPHFLDVCRPDPVKLRYLHSAREPFKGGPIWATISVCQGSPSAVKAAMQSFPSGHSASVLTAGVFLALYLNAKLKAFSNYQTRFWKMILVIMPVVGAICAAGLLLVDGNHHPRDVITSVIFGTIIGLLAYRAQYHSAFSYNDNHVPLPYRERTLSEAERKGRSRFLLVNWTRRDEVEGATEDAGGNPTTEAGRDGEAGKSNRRWRRAERGSRGADVA